MNSDFQTWQHYLETELPRIAALLSSHNITLDEAQPHTKGERFLMRALTTIGGTKLILFGIETTTQRRVVIKVSNDTVGKNELRHERLCRMLLQSVKFSYESFHAPAEILFLEQSPYVLFVTEYVHQDSSFLDRPLEEQFSYALLALKAQERTRATTYNHLTQIRQVFGSRNSATYLALVDTFIHLNEVNCSSEIIRGLLIETKARLVENKTLVDQYGNFLTHTDFVPHNFRISDNTLYLLDFSSLRFGNKHEGWGRFLNFMTLYNPELESLLITYVEENRSAGERASLQVMRLFRLGEIIAYYTKTLENSHGDLLTLNQLRITFWSEVLKAELEDTRVSNTVVAEYRRKRDVLRSNEEKLRQIGLH